MIRMVGGMIDERIGGVIFFKLKPWNIEREREAEGC